MKVNIWDETYLLRLKAGTAREKPMSAGEM